MSQCLIYLDSSALVKLVVRERESKALVDFLADWPHRVASVLVRLEVLRALRRSHAKYSEYRRAEDVFSGLTLIRIDDDILSLAATLDPAEIRSLDAVHLATALALSSELGGMATYDSKLAKAAMMHNMPVFAPA